LRTDLAELLRRHGYRTADDDPLLGLVVELFRFLEGLPALPLPERPDQPRLGGVEARQRTSRASARRRDTGCSSATNAATRTASKYVDGAMARMSEMTVWTPT
jgi:hypothetical protein